MKELISLIPLEVQKFWHKLGPFFDFFHNMVKDVNIRRINYLTRVNLISLFIDLAGRFNSQVEYTVPPFDKLVATVCILTRYQPLIIHLFGIPQEFQPSEEEVREELTRIAPSPHWLLDTVENGLQLAGA